MNDTSRVYAAEDTLLFMLDNPGTVDFMGSSLTMPIERRFGGVAAVLDYLRAVRELPWGHAEVPMPAVRTRKGHTRAHWQDGVIALPDGIGDKGWAMREVVVLHEYAHHVTWHLYGQTGHGPGFQEVFLGLLERAVGPEAAFVVRAGLNSSASPPP